MWHYFPRERDTREIHTFLRSSEIAVISVFDLDLPFPPIKLECPCFDTSELARAGKELPTSYRATMLAAR